MLLGAYTNIGIDEPSNHNEILDFVFEDVLNNADLTSKNLLFDVRKSLLKWIETKNATYIHAYKPVSQKLDTGMLGDRKCTEGLHIPSYMGKPTPRITGFNPGVVENIWSEIRNNFEDEGIVYIDAWEDEDDDSDGRVIATVNAATGEVTYKDPRAVNDMYAQEIIQLTLKEVLLRNVIELEYSADMGSLKIGTDDVSLFISNGFGDGRFKTYVNLNKVEPTKTMNFEGHFTVRTSGNVRIFRYDCSTDAIYTFTKTGRYFCYSDNGTVYILWNDNCVVS